MLDAATTDLAASIDARHVHQALLSFGPNKAPGPDNLRPKVLGNLTIEAYTLIAAVYRQSLTDGFIPDRLLAMKVRFLPKSGKDKYESPKAYRPITLSNFLLKGLERIVQWRLQETTLSEPLLNQHAYTRGRSTETALEDVVFYLKKYRIKDRFTMATSLDCSGAFDNVTFDSS